MYHPIFWDLSSGWVTEDRRTDGDRDEDWEVQRAGKDGALLPVVRRPACLRSPNHHRTMGDARPIFEIKSPSTELTTYRLGFISYYRLTNRVTGIGHTYRYLQAEHGLAWGEP
jgi:hypothetical protein